MGGFIVIPLLLVWYYAFTDKTGAFTLDNLTKIFFMGELQAPVSGSASLPLQYPFVLPFGLPLSHGASEPKGGKGFLCGLYLLFCPWWMNSLLPHPWPGRPLLERKGVLNELLLALHLPAQNLINTPYAIILGMVYDFLPFMILLSTTP